MFIYTICCLGTESNVEKQENSRIKLSLKTEKLAVSNPSDSKSWYSVRNTREG